jgi:hypothetical protein
MIGSAITGRFESIAPVILHRIAAVEEKRGIRLVHNEQRAPRKRSLEGAAYFRSAAINKVLLFYYRFTS